MSIVKKAKNKIKKLLGKTPEKTLYENYYNKYQRFSFVDGSCISWKSNLKQV